jgi:hypothetical protein
MAARFLRAFAAVLLAQAVFGAPVATADGLPVLGFEGSTRALGSPSGEVRYVTHPAGRDTRVLGLSRDAISPNGDWIYLVQYTSAVDPTRYRVRALKVQTERLVTHDIVDPRDRAEANPVTRATSLDGRWAYTLYDGAGHPFVHALDTTSQEARCIDVPASPANSDPWACRLQFTRDRAQTAAHEQRPHIRVDRHRHADRSPPLAGPQLTTTCKSGSARITRRSA